MSFGNAYINVFCDKCRTSHELELTPIACDGWDLRNLEDDLERIGWKFEDDTVTCVDCLEEAEDEEHEKKGESK